MALSARPKSITNIEKNIVQPVLRFKIADQKTGFSIQKYTILISLSLVSLIIIRSVLIIKGIPNLELIRLMILADIVDFRRCFYAS